MNQSQPTTVPTHQQQPLPPSTINPIIMAPNQPLQHQILPLSDLSRYRRKKRSRKAESRYLLDTKHESTGTVFYDPSTGVDQGQAEIDVIIDPGIGKWLKPYSRPSAYAVPVGLEGDTAGSPNIPTPAPSVPPSAQPGASVSAATTTLAEQSVEDLDFDMISLGSDTD